MNKFSIIVPAYNVSEYITECIDSIKKQTFKDYEIVVVEDCSTDNTLEILKGMDGIKLVAHEKNKGLGGARNSGISTATGEYIIFLDSDDYLYDENVLEKLNKTIGNENIDIVYSGFEARGARNFSFIPTKEQCEKEYRLAKNKYISVCAGCWSRELLNKHNIRFKEGVIYEDVYFMFYATAKSNTFKLAEYPTFIYRAGREGSLTTKKQFKQVHDTLTCIENLCELKEKIDKKYFPCLIERIMEQQDRMVVRLQRVIDMDFKEE